MFGEPNGILDSAFAPQQMVSGVGRVCRVCVA